MDLLHPLLHALQGHLTLQAQVLFLVVLLLYHNLLHALQRLHGQLLLQKRRLHPFLFHGRLHLHELRAHLHLRQVHLEQLRPCLGHLDALGRRRRLHPVQIVVLRVKRRQQPQHFQRQLVAPARALLDLQGVKRRQQHVLLHHLLLPQEAQHAH